jgi:FixJ family two-component response regulator
MTARNNVIAVVDDSEIMSYALEQLLESCGFRTELYVSAEGFIGASATTSADCLVVDVQLGGMSGPDMVRELRARGLHFPVILMSASCDAAIRSAAAESDCVAFLRKPFGPEQLLDAIARAVGDAHERRDHDIPGKMVTRRNNDSTLNRSCK